MTPPARLSAAIEILDRWLAGEPVEKALTNWSRRSRFAGSKDRAAIRDIVFDCVRKRDSYALWGGGLTGRGLVLGHSRTGRAELEIRELFSGVGHAPAPLTEAEISRLFYTKFRLSWNVMANMPLWLQPELEASLGDQCLPICAKLTERAPTFLRVNLPRISRDAAIEELAKEDIVAIPHDVVDCALEVIENPRKIASCKTYDDGLVELQDAASQAVCAGLPAASRVLDYCAGGGGKSLAYGAMNNAELFAHDANPSRMRDLGPRADRAGVQITQLDTAECAQSGTFDLVICDVPCSGSGAWRRAPDGKWRLTPDRLAELMQVQRQILEQARLLVKPKGTLAYVTCSLLDCENQQQIDAFLADNQAWSCIFSRQYTPFDGGDGFFVAHMTSSKAETG